MMVELPITKESTLFFQYLFGGKIAQDKQLLETIHTYVLPSDQSKYCLGLYHFDMGFMRITMVLGREAMLSSIHLLERNFKNY
jgi:hypothetical protein